LLVLACLAVEPSRKGSRQTTPHFGAAWFLLAYLPISNAVDLNATVARALLYLPSVGFLLFVAGCVIELPRPAADLRPPWPVSSSLLQRAELFRSSDWLTNEIFYTRTWRGGGSVRVVLNLGQSTRQGTISRAEMLFRRAYSSCPLT